MLGSTAYAAQYQQRPAPAGGVIFKRACFRFYDDLPPVDFWYQSWDMSYKDSASSDYVVGLQAARRDTDIVLVDRRKGRWSFGETLLQVRRLKECYPQTSTILIEDTANGPAIINVLRSQIHGIVPVTPQGTKYARAQAAQPIVEGGYVWLPNPRPHGRLVPERAWVEDFLYQCCVFPQGVHDDDVDAFTQLVARCVQRARPGLRSAIW
jgi:predicted phage terminase large subunit-like protein